MVGELSTARSRTGAAAVTTSIPTVGSIGRCTPAARANSPLQRPTQLTTISAASRSPLSVATPVTRPPVRTTSVTRQPVRIVAPARSAARASIPTSRGTSAYPSAGK